MKVKFKRKANYKYNIDKLSGKKISEKYKYKIDNILKGKQSDSETVNEAREQLKEIVSDASVEVLGRTQSTSKL